MPTTEEQLENALHLLQYERHRGVAERVAAMESEFKDLSVKVAEVERDRERQRNGWCRCDADLLEAETKLAAAEATARQLTNDLCDVAADRDRLRRAAAFYRSAAMCGETVTGAEYGLSAAALTQEEPDE